ncbi:MAG: PAS domain-containing protein [Actinobacteria bacterium]|nr:PAS domain-containing protein [Actinomycetota bacterium]
MTKERGGHEHDAETIVRERDWLKTLLDNLKEGVTACDNDGVLTVMNRTARKWHGIRNDPVSPEEWSEHLHLYKKDGVTRLTLQEIPLYLALQGEDVQNVEVVIAAPHQPHRLVSVSGNALYDDAGNKLGALVVMHDLAQRTRADSAEVELEIERSTAEVRQREALRINDRVVQSLVAAAWVWDDDVEKARESLTKALRSAKDIVGGLIGELKVDGQLEVGALRNADPVEDTDEE